MVRLVAIVLILATIAVLLLLRRRVKMAPFVRVGDIPAIVAQLQASGRDGDYANFSFNRPGEAATDATVIEMQCSIERGRLGFDWPLLFGRNIADKDKVSDFMRRQGHVATDREKNDIGYLRAEDGDVVVLCMRILGDLYGFTPADQVRLVAEGFAWRGTDDNSSP